MTVESTQGMFAGNWSPDGTKVVFSLFGPDRADIGVLTVADKPSWAPLLATEAAEYSPAVSPDGAWIAYVSDETGRPEVYVQRFPELGSRQLVSTNGGLDPV